MKDRLPSAKKPRQQAERKPIGERLPSDALGSGGTDVKGTIKAFWADALGAMPRGPTRATVSWAAAAEVLDDAAIRRLDVHRRKILPALLAALGRPCAPFCRFVDAGTVSPRSDIDVTVFFYRPLVAMRLLEELTLEWFGPDASLDRILEINVYFHTWYMYCRRHNVIEPLEQSRDRAEVHDDARVVRNQTAWSAVRLTLLATKVATKVAPSGAPSGTASVATKVASRAASGLSELWRSLPARVRADAEETIATHDLAEFATEAQRMRRRSAHLHRWRSAVARMDALLGGLPNAAEAAAGASNVSSGAASGGPLMEYFDATSLVSFLETDAYLSYGAYEHVVVQLQLGKHGLLLSPDEYVMSLYDNLGFLATEVHAHEAGEDGPVTDGMLKYMHRCVDALGRVRRHGHGRHAILDDLRRRLTPAPDFTDALAEFEHARRRRGQVKRSPHHALGDVIRARLPTARDLLLHLAGEVRKL